MSSRFWLSIPLVLAGTVAAASAEARPAPRLAPIAIGSSSAPIVGRAPDAAELAKRAAVPADEVWFRTGFHVTAKRGIDSALPVPLTGICVLQFGAPIEPAQLAALEAAGVQVLDFVQHHAVLVFVAPGVASAIEAAVADGTLRAVVPYPPEARFDRELLEGPLDGLEDVVVRLVDATDSVAMSALGRHFITLRWIGTRHSAFAQGLVRRTSIPALAASPGVLWVERRERNRPLNLEGAMSGGADHVVGVGDVTGAGVRVAVVDTGVLRDGSSGECLMSSSAYHPDLGAARIFDQYDFQNDDANACDDEGHGTHVAGSIAGDGTEQGDWKGLAPAATLLIYKDCCDSDDTGFGNFDAVLERAAAHDADVVGNSWGCGTCQDEYTVSSYLADAAMRGAYDGSDGSPRYPFISCSAGNDALTIGSLAAAKNAVTVGALRDGNSEDQKCICALGGDDDCNLDCNDWGQSCTADMAPADRIACFSNHGPVDTDRDGATRVKPDVVAPGTTIVSTAASHLFVDNRLYTTKLGTSMAQPMVAGMAALLLEAFPALRDWPALLKARLLATATPLGDSSFYGHGVIDAYHAVYDSSSIETVLSAFSYLPAAGAEVDHEFTIPGGFSEVRVFLVWMDPPSYATEAVNDLDLRVYDASNALVGSALKTDDPVEAVRVSTGEPGTWRANVKAFDLPVPQSYGIVAVVVRKDPKLTLWKSPSATCLGRGDTFTVTTVLSNSGATVAASVIGIDLPGTNGIQLDSVDVATSDPKRSHRYGRDDLDAIGGQRYDLTVGETNSEISRQAVWNLRVDDEATAGEHTIAFIGQGHDALAPVHFLTVTVDGDPPGSISALGSNTHTLGECSDQASVTMNWTAASDGSGCGLGGYSAAWTTGAPALPPPTQNVGLVTSSTSTLDTSSLPYYFSIRAVDSSGNWSPSYQSWGPIYVDAIDAGLVTNLTSSTHPLNACTPALSVTMAWSPAPDWHCGLDGYSVFWSTGSPQMPGTTKILGNVTTVTQALTPTNSPRYFSIRAVDAAGNWSPSYVSYGPFYIDYLPAEIQELRAVRDAGNIAFTWNSQVNADTYHVYQSTDPQFSSPTLVGNVVGAPFTQLGGIGSGPPTAFYRVVGTNACNDEGP